MLQQQCGPEVGDNFKVLILEGLHCSREICRSACTKCTAHYNNEERKVKTNGTDSARNMTVAARLLANKHMPCIAHSLQRSIATAIRDSGFERVSQ